MGSAYSWIYNVMDRNGTFGYEFEMVRNVSIYVKQTIDERASGICLYEVKVILRRGQKKINTEIIIIEGNFII